MKASIVLATTACLIGLAAETHSATGGDRPAPVATLTTGTPPARMNHMFTGNGAAGASANRLYLYGGGNGSTVFNDLWYYQTDSNAWILVTPVGKSRPGPRQTAGWSCGGGTCVLEDGNKGCCMIDETWMYVEATKAWSKISCTASTPCPSGRKAPAMAFDPDSQQHLLFGGSSLGYRVRPSDIFNDTYTFDPSTRRWTKLSPTNKPSPREGAAAAFVPDVGIVLFGGMDQLNKLQCDMFVWTGGDWVAVTAGSNSPCLYAHSMVWTGTDLVVGGGYTVEGLANSTTYRFQFNADKRSGTWATSSPGTCQNPTGGTDYVIHSRATMAADDTLPATRVYFGGSQSGTYYNNTVECTD